MIEISRNCFKRTQNQCVTLCITSGEALQLIATLLSDSNRWPKVGFGRRAVGGELLRVAAPLSNSPLEGQSPIRLVGVGCGQQTTKTRWPLRVWSGQPDEQPRKKGRLGITR